MEKIILDFINSIIKKAIDGFIEFAGGTLTYYLSIEKEIEAVASGFDFQKLYTFLTAVSLGLAVLLFLKKGFEIYILWNDGDSDLDPFVFLASYIKIIVVTVWFTSLYGYGINIAEKIFKRLIQSIVGETDLSAGDFLKVIFESIDFSVGILQTAFLIILLINTIKLVIQFYQRGLELFLLRLGVPLAALDMLNADSAGWRSYVKKMIQIVLTLMLQLFLYSLSLMIGVNGLRSFIIAIAVQKTAISLPTFLSEFLVTGSGGNGGLISKASTGAHLISSIKNILRR